MSVTVVSEFSQMSVALWKIFSACCYLIVTGLEFTKCDKTELSTPSEHNSSKIRAVKYCVTGDVQGEDFLNAVCMKATDLQITGWIKPLLKKSNREVKLFLEGTPDSADHIIKWISHRSNHGHVIEYVGIKTDKFIKKRRYKSFTVYNASHSGDDGDGDSNEDDDDEDNNNTDSSDDGSNDISDDNDNGDGDSIIKRNGIAHGKQGSTQASTEYSYSSYNGTGPTTKIIPPSQYGAKEVTYDETVPKKSQKVSPKSTIGQQLTSTTTNRKLTSHYTTQTTQVETYRLGTKKRKTTTVKHRQVSRKKCVSTSEESVFPSNEFSKSVKSNQRGDLTDEKETSIDTSTAVATTEPSTIETTTSTTTGTTSKKTEDTTSTTGSSTYTSISTPKTKVTYKVSRRPTDIVTLSTRVYPKFKPITIFRTGPTIALRDVKRYDQQRDWTYGGPTSTERISYYDQPKDRPYRGFTFTERHTDKRYRVASAETIKRPKYSSESSYSRSYTDSDSKSSSYTSRRRRKHKLHRRHSSDSDHSYSSDEELSVSHIKKRKHDGKVRKKHRRRKHSSDESESSSGYSSQEYRKRKGDKLRKRDKDIKYSSQETLSEYYRKYRQSHNDEDKKHRRRNKHFSDTSGSRNDMTQRPIWKAKNVYHRNRKRWLESSSKEETQKLRLKKAKDKKLTTLTSVKGSDSDGSSSEGDQSETYETVSMN